MLTADPVLAAVPRLWPGETVVCLGGGPSLTAEDAAYVRGKARVIAIKEAGHCSLQGVAPVAPWADALYACDAKWWRWEHGAPAFSGLKFALEPQAVRFPDVTVLKNLGEEGLSLEPTGLKTGNNSGYQAINLAVLLGASRVILLGYDMWRRADGESNWFGKHPNHVPSPYHLFLQRYGTIVEPLKAAGVEVLNASRHTMLSAFPRVVLEDVL